MTAFTRDEAEERHRNREHYVLATQLPDGLLLLLLIFSGGFFLELRGAHFVATAASLRKPDVDGMVDVDVTVHNPKNGWSIWEWRLERADAEVRILDNRNADSVERGWRSRKVTEAEMNRFRCPMPGFGEFDAGVRIVLDLLRSEGYGELE